MQKKPILTVLCSVIAMMVAAVAIVLVAGPHVGATSVEGDTLIFDDWDDYDIDSDGVLYGLSSTAYEKYYYNQIYYNDQSDSWDFNGSVKKIFYKIPEGVKRIKSIDNFVKYNAAVFGELPTTLEEVDGGCLLHFAGNTSITVPEKISSGEGIFADYHHWYNLKVIIVQDEALLEDYAIRNIIEYDAYFYGRTITVRYDAPTYTATFDVAGGSAVENQTITKGAKVTKPENPTKAGYNFLGWYNGEGAYDFDSAVNGDVALTAKWEAVQTQPEPTEPEAPAEENNSEVNNQNNAGLIWGIAGTAAGILIVAGIVVGIVISKRRRK